MRRDINSLAVAGEKRLDKANGRYSLYASEITDLMLKADESPAALFCVITNVYAMGVEAGARMIINKKRAKR